MRNRVRLGLLRMLVLASLLAGLLVAVGPASRQPVAAAAPSLGVVPAAHALYNGVGVSGYGDAPTLGTFSGLTLGSPAVAMAATSDGKGYWVAGADGGVFTFGDAPFYGSMGGTQLYAPVVGMAATPDGKGYWLVAADGGVFTFGDAPFYGSMGGTQLYAPVVGMAATPDGKGYWLVAADGGVFTFGDAPFYGSMGGTRLDAPVVGMAATPDGEGYWLAAADGGVFTFGDASFYGSAADDPIGTNVTGIAATKDGKGYWLVAATAGVLIFGDAPFLGPTPNLPPFSPTAAITATPDGGGYWLLQPDDIATNFADPPPSPSFPGGWTSVEVAAGQVGPDPDASEGQFCNPYGPCEQWCSLFATWAFEQAGIAIPRYPFVGDVYEWAALHGRVLPHTAVPAPGDGVLYGTGPKNTATSVHMGIVAQVWPDGAIITVEGDAGPQPDGQYGVVINGPFLPADSLAYNGMPIYAFVQL